MPDIVFLNGCFQDAGDARVSVLDRGFTYGDGLFETTRVARGRPFAWTEHWHRFAHGLEVLRLRSPYSEPEVHAAAVELLQRHSLQQGYLKWSLSRGIGPRGYGIAGCVNPTFLIQCGPLPALEANRPLQWSLATVGWQLPPPSPLAACKHSNKLIQVLAKADAQAQGADEPLLSGIDGTVAEAASGNLAWIRKGCLIRPPRQLGSLHGVTEQIVERLAEPLGLRTREEAVCPADLFQMEGVILTLSTYGIVEGVALDGQPLPRSEFTTRLWKAYEAELRGEKR